ncbi:extensin family protein [Gemmobacter aquarius]|uniref:Extensin family protein n=2 Tax=Paragemmobacter aquarius TaxID=2169400 RepID=A0A2S0URM7_9RHOB|nr:extensin family protein [Gemmobacter aquarius]
MTTSPRPLPRPVEVAAATAPRPKPRPPVTELPQAVPPEALAQLPPSLAAPVVRPMPRPAALAAPVPALLAVTVAKALPGMIRPMPRPATLLASAPVKPEKGGLGGLFGNRKPRKPVATDGFVCGDPDIRGDELAPVTSKVKGCGIDEPVRITSIDGIRLRGTATINCETASALKTWIEKGMRPAMSKEVVELQIAGSYVCRPRNNVRGNKISEHGRGKAVDIAAFVFSDGSEWSVSRDYNRQMRKAHKAACGIFGTTLGPGSDGYHEDHLHFDTASYRSGPYCR